MEFGSPGDAGEAVAVASPWILFLRPRPRRVGMVSGVGARFVRSCAVVVVWRSPDLLLRYGCWYSVSLLPRRAGQGPRVTTSRSSDGR